MNNELSRIHSLVDSDGTTHLADYTYLGRDRTVQVDFPQPGAKFTYIKQGSEGNGDGGDQYTGWDRFGRAIDLRWIKNSTSAHLERLQHGYDRANNRLYRKNLVATDSAQQDELYAYDGLSQLTVFQRGVLNEGRTAISGTPAAEEDFTFDPTGNWNKYVREASGSTTLDQTRTHNKANELLTIDGTNTFSQEDEAGNMKVVPQPGGWNAGYYLKYDAWNRLVQVKDGATVVATYTYDGLNRRVTKTVGSIPRHFYYTDKWQIIEERIYTNTTADRQFVWGIRYTDDLVLRDKGTERLYVIQDYFQPTAVMDTTGAVVERYGYEAFGTSRVMTPTYGSRTTSSYDWETRYGAYRWDAETGLYQVRNRYLHAGLGRWVTRDPIGYRGGINLYGYVRNTPTNTVDPLGLDGWWSGFTESLCDSWNSIGDGIVAPFYGGWDALDDAYDSGVFGQTVDADGITYYGTRAAVGVAAAATAWLVAAEVGPALWSLNISSVGGTTTIGEVVQLTASLPIIAAEAAAPYVVAGYQAASVFVATHPAILPYTIGGVTYVLGLITDYNGGPPNPTNNRVDGFFMGLDLVTELVIQNRQRPPTGFPYAPPLPPYGRPLVYRNSINDVILGPLLPPPPPRSPILTNPRN